MSDLEREKIRANRELRRVEAELARVEAEAERLRQDLPHLHAYPWYSWAWEFFQSRNKINLLCAANQISKSSTQIRKCIEWAGNYDLWDELWPGKQCRMMWYLYPTREVFMIEWNTKWVEFMPRGSCGENSDHPKYGWKKIKEKNEFVGVEFNSGMMLYFRQYAQKAHHLQSGTAGSIFTDEELPVELYDELIMRVAGLDGYFHMVFTATLNQPMWKDALEGSGRNEMFPDAWKRQVSMYDCLSYMDGSPTPWTLERIAEVEAKCGSETEKQRRVHGKFVTEVGRKYPQFDTTKHYIKPFKIPGNYSIYTGVDIGSGGAGGHPPAICFVAVRDDFRFGVAFMGWLGDDGKNYTVGDIYEKYLQMKGKLSVVEQRYDQAARDFKTITDRAGDTFLPANKKHTDGEDCLNLLFKNNMLLLFDCDPMPKLGAQLMSLMRDTAKNKAIDDFADALRYCVTTIPWDWSNLRKAKSITEIRDALEAPLTEKELLALEISKRRGKFYDPMKERGRSLEQIGWDEIIDDIDDWNEFYGE